jgi:hypothetical protein
MTTTIGGVTLDRDMVWTDEYMWSKRRGGYTPTIGGGGIVQDFAASESGRPITLESAGGQGSQKKSTVEALIELEAVPGATYTLSIVHNGLTMSKTVLFRPGEEDGAVQFTQRTPCDGLQGDDHWYNGRVLLIVA